MRPEAVRVPPPIPDPAKRGARPRARRRPQEAHRLGIAQRAHLDDVQREKLDRAALGALLHAHGPAPRAQVGLGPRVHGHPRHANRGRRAHGEDERGARAGLKGWEEEVRELRGEAEVGVDLGVDILRRQGLVAQADVVDEDGEVQVSHELWQTGGLDGLVLVGVEEEDANLDGRVEGLD